MLYKDCRAGHGRAELETPGCCFCEHLHPSPAPRLPAQQANQHEGYQGVVCGCGVSPGNEGAAEKTAPSNGTAASREISVLGAVVHCLQQRGFPW